MDKDLILFKIKKFFRKLSRKIKKLYKKIRRIVRKYIRMLIRHTKAHDYTILIYSILALLLLIFIFSSIGKALTGGKKHKKAKTEVTTEEITTEEIISPEEQKKRQLSLQCKEAYDKNKDLLILVSDSSPLPENYDFEHYTLNSGYDVDERIVDDLKSMLEACNSSNFEYNILSAYRSREDQQDIIDNTIYRYVNEDGMDEEAAEKKALESVQQVGCSEHESGLALDISSYDTIELEDYVKDDPTNKWLMDNCHNYGFILRYPENKTDITKITYEPWHFRYVGKEAAAIMKINNLTLEEFLDLVAYSSTF